MAVGMEAALVVVKEGDWVAMMVVGGGRGDGGGEEGDVVVAGVLAVAKRLRFLHK